MKRVYMFGFSASLTDSTAYLTDVQVVDSAWINPAHGFLEDRALYSLQLQYHVESVEHHKNTVCTIFFDKNQKKAMRRWAKVRKRYAKDTAVRLQILPKERFHFIAEKYLPPIIGEIETAPVATDSIAVKPSMPAKSGMPAPGGKAPASGRKPMKGPMR